MQDFDGGDSPFDYQMPVHVSLTRPVQFFGIGEQAFIMVLMLSVVLATLVSVWCVSVGIVALLVLRQLCRDEPLLVDFLLENLSLADRYRG